MAVRVLESKGCIEILPLLEEPEWRRTGGTRLGDDLLATSSVAAETRYPHRWFLTAPRWIILKFDRQTDI